jgi:pectate lyase
VGREFIRWASEDLAIYARRSYDPATGKFIALMTDGTPIRWRESRTGYYVPESFQPQTPDGINLWAYAMAYRLTGDSAHWQMARTIAKGLTLGDLGEPDGRRELQMDTDNDVWHTVYALLELYRATSDRSILRLACRVGDNILKMQASSGLFPRPGRDYARTGDEVPLALLHLAAAVDGKQAALPPPVYDSQFFHCQYDGELRPDQQKRADSRTYDHMVFYGKP